MVNISRKLYSTPHLVILGDFRTLTLGGSPGLGDSGCSGVEKSPPPFRGCPVDPDISVTSPFSVNGNGFPTQPPFPKP
jgi:hypothetical protein